MFSVISYAIILFLPLLQRTVSEESAAVPSRGGRKYQLDTELVGDAEAWRSERTERRVPSREFTSRERSASRRADYHVSILTNTLVFYFKMYYYSELHLFLFFSKVFSNVLGRLL